MRGALKKIVANMDTTPIFESPYPERFGFDMVQKIGPQPATAEYIEKMFRHAGERHLDIGPEFLGFMDDYYHLAQYLRARARKHTVIVDVGCAGAFQQVFFQDFPGYIGIDLDLRFVELLSPTASFIEGDFGELVESGKFVANENMIGIANMSLLYGGGAKSVEAFNRVFRQKIIT